MNKNYETGVIKTLPKKWSSDEEKNLILLAQNHNIKQIANLLDRSEVSISVKLKRLQKSEYTYNSKHIKEKNLLTEQFLKNIKPNTVLDLYAGELSFYDGKVKNLTCNDLYIKHHAYTMDSLKCLCLLYTKNKKYDLIDLDPFGSAYDCFDLAIKIAKKGLIITLGELGHRRFRRLDFVKRYYGITNLKDFTIENLITHIKIIGNRNKKELIPIFYRDWNNTGRVYFIIKKIKITEQWENKNYENNFV